jgi:UDP-glucose 4-epimerase
VRELAKEGYRVLACDLSEVPTALRKAVKEVGGQVTWHQLDVTNMEQWEALGEDVDTVIHAAAVTPTDESDPVGVVNVNLVGTLNGLEYARKFGVRRFIALSSSSVYRDLPYEDRPLREDDPVRPIHAYGISKVALESFITLYRARKGLDCCAVRMTSIYGPWERPTGSRLGMSPVYRLMTAVAAGKVLTVKDEGGTCDYMYVTDAARGLIHLAELDEVPYDIVNLSSGESIGARRLIDTVKELAPELAPTVLGPEADPGEADLVFRPVRDSRRLDLQRLESLGFSAPTSIEQGLALYLEWLRDEANFETVTG